MPRAGDAFLTSALPQTHNPLNRIDTNFFKPEFDVEAFIEQMTRLLQDYLIPIIENLTGIDLSGAEGFITSLIGIVTSGGPAADFAAALLGILGVGVGDLPNTVNGFFALLNSLFGGLTGSPTGGQQTPGTVGGAVGSQTATIAALAAAVNALTQQNTAESTGATLAIDAFTRTGPDLGADWDVEIFNDVFTSGYVKTDGSQAVYIPGGFGSTTVIARFQGTNHTAATDITETAVVFGAPLSSQMGAPTAVDVHGRMSPDRENSVRARLITQGFSNILQLHSRVNSTAPGVGETLIGAKDLGPQPAVGATPKLVCGTDINDRQFLVILNNKIHTFTEVGTTSRLGVGYRERGVGWLSGGSFFGQGQAGAVTHWTSIDVGAPTGLTPATADTVDGGTAAAPSADVYDGGSAATPATDIIDGGSA